MADRSYPITPKQRPNEGLDVGFSNKRPSVYSSGVTSKGHPITPAKRPNEGLEVGCFKKRPSESSFGATSKALVLASPRVYKLKIFLPNGVPVLLEIPEGMEAMKVREVVGRVRKEYERAILEEKFSTPDRDVNWDAELFFLDDSNNVFKNTLRFAKLEPNRTYNLRLHDGSQPAEVYQNMWDLTPDTELLKELPEEYTFETALADLIDNSLQAVWSNGENERRLIRVEVAEDKISVFDTGPGMDSTSIEKWGKMGASLHRASKAKAIGGKPPYLKPAFGMFGYGGFFASMHLGRRTEVSSKTKDCRKVYTLHLERDALLSGSGSKGTWRTYGRLRDPMEDELKLSPDGSFTKVEIFEPKMRSVGVSHLQCKLKDIYFPYIQCDDLSKTGRTTMPIEFQVNGDDLAEIQGGEVAITNLHSCNGPEFILQLRFQFNQDNAMANSPGGAKTSQEANARLKCVYLPVIEGKESVENILDNLKAHSYGITEEYESFSHVSIRRLGRLLPDARWAWIPFMDFRQRKGEKAQVLKRCCMRVKCFIETDAGFNPKPSKTDFAHQNPFAAALRNLGNKQPLEKETGVDIEIRRDGKPLTLSQLDKQYQEWLLQMHELYDEEVDCGIDEPVLILNPTNKKDLRISKNIVRVHKAFRRKGTSWESGQRIKVLKGACAGVHKNHIYATLEYILIEGMEGDAGAEARIICRPLDTSEENGCVLRFNNENPSLDIRKSISIPINVIDSGKCLAIDNTEWDNQLEKLHQKSASSIEILCARDLHELGISVALPIDAEVDAGHVPPDEIVAVIRPASFKSGIASNLDQKYILKDNFDMSLTITWAEDENCQDEPSIYSRRETPSSRNNLHGLYIFRPTCKLQPLFKKAGVYTFSFSIRDTHCGKYVQKVWVKALPEVQRWELTEPIRHPGILVGSCFPPVSVAFFDRYNNRIPLFKKVPKMVVKLKANKSALVHIHRPTTSISSDKLSLVLKDLLVESSDLDKIRPSYEATLVICRLDDPHFKEVPFKVFPGPIKRVIVQSENFEKQLIPGHVVQELVLELFDAYGNHIRENETIQLSMDGFCLIDRAASTRKVDDRGYVDLGGLLKVIAGYGRRVSMSVLSNERVIAKEEWQIENRHLRTASVIPGSCVAGSQLENIVFEVVDSNGVVDVNIHDEDKIGRSHTLTLKSQFVDIDESVKYVFHYGRCNVRAIPIPAEEGVFSFVAAHSRHPELQLTVKVSLELPLEPEPEHHNFEPLSTDGGAFLLPNSMDPPMESVDTLHRHPEQVEYRDVQHHPDDQMVLDSSSDKNADSIINSFLDLQKELECEIVVYGSSIHQHEENLRLLKTQQMEIESQLSQLQASRDKILCTGTYGTPGKEVVRERIESLNDCAAAVVLKICRIPSDGAREFKRHVLGVVALLGTAPTVELSRLFAEYLGDQMLAVVCRSYDDICVLEMYKKNGNLDRTMLLHSLAAKLGKNIPRRYLVLCLEDIRAYQGGTDLHGKLALPSPTLPTGATPAGFLGYAVNFINVDVDHLETRTNAGHGLRETLFYRLFRETQVYESREDMKRAISCIKDGAISLDGGIVRGDGAMSLGCWEPDIIFPVVTAKNQEMSLPSMDVVKQYQEKKRKLEETIAEIEKEEAGLKKVMKKWEKRRNMYSKYFTDTVQLPNLDERPIAIASSSYVDPTTTLEEKPVIGNSCYPSAL